MYKNKGLTFLIVVAIGVILGYWFFVNFYYEDLEKAVKTAFDSVIAEDKNTAEKYLDYEKLYGGQDDKVLYELILKDFSYDIISLSENESEATAELTVKNRDIESIYGQFVVDAYQLVISDAYRPEDERMGTAELKSEIDNMLLDKLENADVDMLTQTTVINIIRRGRSWYIDLNEENMDAIYGGYLAAQKAADNVLGDRSTEALRKLEAAYQQKIDDTNHVLRNAAHYMVDDLWNGELVHIVSCINAGTDASGNEYDLKSGIEKMQVILKDKDEYDAYIAELDDTYYLDIKTRWQAVSEACDALTSNIVEAEPDPIDHDYIPDTTDFEDAMKQFVELVYPQ